MVSPSSNELATCAPPSADGAGREALDLGEAFQPALDDPETLELIGKRINRARPGEVRTHSVPLLDENLERALESRATGASSTRIRP